ncbi:30S ribosomal protein S4 [Candidatus Shapirobacteria bacterium RIFOXYD1_FULL_38_32]|uniref:Small ribosomal subunit protein uS4 n=3 Tax=Candidatus Shapironibacteriota TaxID=1752721 RepID=A0A0G0JYH7_9BACT|nr:MAG: SSU ribosomal protein S4p (S9e) [Candidatus Shapirobacteria bacterium GW2011_GWE2_38_30]KKQ91229.1 MAG: SSU ribosomal protein S4p (S9e) [Candidatus Shapirobacteria bacterium GW2011_GWE1_38_92]OGL55883.1 MAG: 30S ribosomal protein S4 [Candidatus Shapirobacteria bacterium RIFOXYA1_FULL_39_17]OGL56836.1 MAG: 30S ribosomal protein S4 [Candidatus Shapirobacteria bacterium RIFOXYC1_FULL_38_24]OGL57130.1 MAG: 30S ribosomal protein S4 [Candidatus Shapirobacteria bacterium RIFOXYD1_FULL_38_32]O
MSRITQNSKCRLCRTEGTKLYLKGSRCLSAKCPIEKKGAVRPGMHGLKRTKKPTDYGIQLRAKQKAKRIYGVQETQFNNYYKKAKLLKGKLGENLLILLETRLDSVLYTSGLADSRSQSKQFISHGHVLVNGSPLSISSYALKINDEITLDKSTIDQIKDTSKIKEKDFRLPGWLLLNKPNFSVKLTNLPTREDITPEIDENLIIEYYSR